jgi:dienelactone hydrolase
MLLLAVGVVALVAAGCIPPPPPPPPDVPPMTVGVTHTVAVANYTFVDTTRWVPPYGDYPGAFERDLPTTVWYPTDGGGPFPLVVFAHGYAVTPAAYVPLLQQIASAGYVVAAPTYPLLSGQPAGPTDTVGFDLLPGDTSFVISQVAALSTSGDPALGGRVDPSRIAVAGHSDGAAVAFNVGYTPFDVDSRVRAVVAFNADLSYYGSYQANGRPILDVLSDQDVYNPYQPAIDWARDTLQAPRTLLSLWNASHEGPVMDPGDPHYDVVVHTTIGFLDATLKDHPEQLDQAQAYVAQRPGLAAIG